jgi:hypothetical protein
MFNKVKGYFGDGMDGYGFPGMPKNMCIMHVVFATGWLECGWLHQQNGETNLILRDPFPMIIFVSYVI